MNTTTEETTTTLILAGSGYELTIAPEAEARKAELLADAAGIQCVRDNDESFSAQFQSRKLAALRIEVEKCRKLVKEPVNRIGKLIDQTAANFVEAINAEEKRITKLIGEHAEEVARLRTQKEEEERKAFEAARAAREAAESGGIAAVLAAKAALAEKLQASNDLAATKVADGVRFAWDFEIMDIAEVYRSAPELVELTYRRSAILAWFRELEAADDDVKAKAMMVGIEAFKKPVVSSR